MKNIISILLVLVSTSACAAEQAPIQPCSAPAAVPTQIAVPTPAAATVSLSKEDEAKYEITIQELQKSTESVSEAEKAALAAALAETAAKVDAEKAKVASSKIVLKSAIVKASEATAFRKLKEEELEKAKAAEAKATAKVSAARTHLASAMKVLKTAGSELHALKDLAIKQANEGIAKYLVIVKTL